MDSSEIYSPLSSISSISTSSSSSSDDEVEELMRQLLPKITTAVQSITSYVTRRRGIGRGRVKGSLEREKGTQQLTTLTNCPMSINANALVVQNNPAANHVDPNSSVKIRNEFSNGAPPYSNSFMSGSKIPINANALVVQNNPAMNHADPNISIKTENKIPNGAPPYANSLMSGSKKLQDELEKTGIKMKQHEDNLKFLKTQQNQLDDAILDLQVSLGNYLPASAPESEVQDTSHVRNEEEIVEKILKHEKSAASIFSQLKSHHGSQLSDLTLSQDVLGVLATLGKVDDDNLSRLFAEYLGLQTMLAIVSKTYEGIKALEMYDGEGLVDKGSGIHGLGASIGRALEGRFLVICLDHLRPYPGEILADDPQRRLDIPNPRLPNGDVPAGFLGFAVNMIHVDGAHLFCLTSSGWGLRETLFYNLFSRLQVYRTRDEMTLALPCITSGAVSLDGGMIRATGVFSLGSREDVDVRFPKCFQRSDLSENYYELENQIKQKKWEKEGIIEDMRREQALLDQAKCNFQLKKQDFLEFLADSSSYITQHQMQTTGRDRQGPQR